MRGVACTLASFAGLAALSGACDVGSEPPGGPSVLLLVADTLRADALGSYGSSLPASPQLDDFARGGLLFEQAIAPSPHTAPSHATMFTSTHPATHRIWNGVNPSGERDLHPRLPDEAVTLAEVFADAGYATAAFADGGWVTPARGFDQGFQIFDSRYVGVRNRVRAASDWLRERDEERPFFLLVHTYEVHAPYVPPPGTEAPFANPAYTGFLRELVEEIRAQESDAGLADLPDMVAPVRRDPAPDHVAFLRALYHGEVLEVDRAFGELFRTLGELSLTGSTLVVVTSDHGEEFGEHGGFGHRQVYEPLLRVPLIFVGPGVPAGVRRTGPVELIDLMPTLLRYAGLEVPRSVVGRDLALRSRAEPSPEPGRFVVSETPESQQAAVRRGSRKAIFHEGERPPRAELFDLASDPGETRDLSDTPDGAFLLEARRALDAHRTAARRHREEHGLYPRFRSRERLSEIERNALKALGYLSARKDR